MSRPFKNYDDYGPSSDDLKMGRKRGRCVRFDISRSFLLYVESKTRMWGDCLVLVSYRYGNFDTAWKALFKFRWPDLAECVKPVDWQQIYWETHVQKYVSN